MYEVMWQEITASDKIVTNRKGFGTKAALDKFVEKLFQKDGFLKILAYRD